MVSQQVQDSLKEAQKHLRDALAFAARAESPFIIKSIGEMIFNVEHIQEIESLLQHMNEEE